MSLKFIPATINDLAQLADIRVQAMQPSLQALGRFDEDRVRNRLIKSFDANNTYNIILNRQLLGFFAITFIDGDLWLKHLYLSPKAQGKGLGKAVIDHIKTIAVEQNLPIKLQALRDSPANQFYQKHGFVETHQTEWDVFYQWSGQRMAEKAET